MKKRLIALALALLMVLSLTSAVAEDPVKLTWLGYYTSNITVAPDSWAETLLEEKFNVDITAVDDVSQENMDAFVASGGILDVTCYPTYLNSNMAYMYDQELIREFPEEWLYEYYPTGMKILSDFLGADFFEKDMHLVEGKVLCTPIVSTKNIGQYSVIYRKDWLDKLGLSEPTTLQEYHDMLYAFTYNDPDGNGVNDTYGTSCVLADKGLWPVLGAFGMVKPGLYTLKDDGTVVLNGATEDYKTALGILRDWYAAGIIDPESVTDNRSTMRSKWAAGQLGSITSDVGWGTTLYANANLFAMVEDVIPGSQVELMGPLTSPYGDGNVYSAVNFPSVFLNRAMCFTADATDEQIITVLKMFEGMCTDQELCIKLLYGEEGVDYTWSEDGMLIPGAHVTVEYQASKGIGEGFYMNAAKTPYLNDIVLSPRDIAMYDKVADQKLTYAQNNFPNVTSEMYDTYGSEVQKLVDEYFYNTLIGKTNLEADWDAYIANLSKAGLDKILADYEELLK